ncbi:MAG: AAA family ATPase [Bryobacteraceae bacterium]
MLPRHLALLVRRSALGRDPVLLQGPRGAGKTTLARSEFPDRLYVDLSDPADLEAARRAPEAFLVRLRRPAVVDELQRCPELVRHLSERLGPMPVVFVADTRVRLPMETFELHRPTRAERMMRPPMPIGMLGRFVPARDEARIPDRAPAFPEPREYLWRDVPRLIALGEPDRFERFAAMVAARSGGLLHQQAMARELGVAHRTVARWLDALDACFLTLRLEPFEHGLGRRLAKRPKLHFLGPAASFETEVVSEIYRNARHAGLSPELRYWRDSNGLEAPLIVRAEPGSAAVPCAIAEEPGPAEEVRLRRWMELAGVGRGAVIGRAPGGPDSRLGRLPRYALTDF